jgi:class 3 adenylate cyclase/pimeloyl-ACP methyl ester carboxylesterase
MSETRKLAAIVCSDVVGYSRLAGADEDRTLARLRALRSDLIDPTIAVHHGRIVKRTGDGSIVEFRSVVDAVRCAVEVQNAMVERNAGVPEDRRIVFRMGVHVGDVVEESDGDLMGDGVNIAARLEGVAAPGTICLSEDAYRQVKGRLDLAVTDLGPTQLKNIAEPVRAYSLQVGVPAVAKSAGADAAAPAPPPRYEQEIHFCVTSDAVQLAYARTGGGPPLVKTGNWMTHLEFDFESPIWRHLYRELSRDHTLIRYDARGQGLSDREVEEVSFETFVGDLETVVDAAGLERFDLLGISQGCAVAIGYAVRHPERVTRLILYGGYPLGWAKRARSAAEKEQGAAMLTLMRHGWGQENPTFRQLFTSQFIPVGATKEQADWFNELQRVSTSPADAVRNLIACGDTDVSAFLSQVTIPTLVMHARGDARVPFEQGRRLAAGIPGARFVSLPSHNHLILENEPAFQRFLQELRTFLAT